MISGRKAVSVPFNGNYEGKKWLPSPLFEPQKFNFMGNWVLFIQTCVTHNRLFRYHLPVSGAIENQSAKDDFHATLYAPLPAGGARDIINSLFMDTFCWLWKENASSSCIMITMITALCTIDDTDGKRRSVLVVCVQAYLCSPDSKTHCTHNLKMIYNRWSIHDVAGQTWKKPEKPTSLWFICVNSEYMNCFLISTHFSLFRFLV